MYRKQFQFRYNPTMSRYAKCSRNWTTQRQLNKIMSIIYRDTESTFIYRETISIIYRATASVILVHISYQYQKRETTVIVKYIL